MQVCDPVHSPHSTGEAGENLFLLSLKNQKKTHESVQFEI